MIIFYTQNENKKTNIFFTRRTFGVFQQKEFSVETIKNMKIFLKNLCNTQN